MPEASVLLLTKNDRSNLEQVLPRLFTQNTSASFEVIAVDSGSTDGSLEVLQRYPVRVEPIPPEAFHHARTRNFAANLAKGNILVFLSQDAIPASENWLNALVANFEDPRVAAVYGRQFPRPGSSLERHDVLHTIYGEQRIVKDPAHRNGSGYRFYHFSDANAAIRRSVWEIESFPENLKVFEDLGIAKRILDRGWKIVYEPEAAVFHTHDHSTLGLFRRYFDIGYTLRLLKIWDIPDIKTSMLREAFKMISTKFIRKELQRSRPRRGHALGQHLVKSLGLFLGLNQTFLPLALKRHLSAFGVFGEK